MALNHPTQLLGRTPRTAERESTRETAEESQVRRSPPFPVHKERNDRRDYDS